MSLTKAAAAEVAGRDVPVHKDAVGTLHAHCFRGLGRPAICDAKFILEWNKTCDPRWRLSVDPGDLDDAADAPRGDGPGDEIKQRMELARHRCVDRELWDGDLPDFAEAWDEFKNSTGTVDFTDLIRMAIDHDIPVPMGADVLMVDEAQDLSRLEHVLIDRWAARSQGCICVGDPYQALYTWRGAHPEALDTDHGEGRRRILERSYRVPSAVLNASLRWIGDMIHERNAELPPEQRAKIVSYLPRRLQDGSDAPGRVGTNHGSWRNPGPVIAAAEAFAAAGESCMILASCSYQLTPTLAELKKRGVPFSNPWRKKRGDWNPLSSAGATMTDRCKALMLGAGDAEEGGGWTWKTFWTWIKAVATDGVIKHGMRAHTERQAKNHPDEPVTWMDVALVLIDPAPLRAMFEAASGHPKAGENLKSSFALPAREDPIFRRDLCAWYTARVSHQYDRAASYAAAVMERTADPKPLVYIGTIHSVKGAEAKHVLLYPDLSEAGASAWASRGDGRASVYRTFYVGMTRASESLTVCRAVSRGFAAPVWEAL